MSDANVAVTFSASVGDLVSGVAEASDALASLSAPFEQMNGQYASLGASIGHAFDPSRFKPSMPRSPPRLRSKPRSPPPTRKPRRRSVRATTPPTPTRCAPPRRRSPRRSRRSRTASSRSSRSTPTTRASTGSRSRRRSAASRAALDEEYAAELALLQNASALGEQTLAQKQRRARPDTRRRAAASGPDEPDHATGARRAAARI